MSGSDIEPDMYGLSVKDSAKCHDQLMAAVGRTFYGLGRYEITEPMTIRLEDDGRVYARWRGEKR